MKTTMTVKSLVAIRPIRANRYGSIPDLPDEELADPEELERQAYRQMYGPILQLPVKNKARGFRPEWDEDGHIEWGAFGTVDFERLRAKFDRTRYKVEKLRDELADTRILFDIVFERIAGRGKYKVLKYLERGVIELDHIDHFDLWCCGRMYLRMLKLSREIKELRQRRWERTQAKARQWLEDPE